MRTKCLLAVLFVAVVLIGMPVKALAQGVIKGTIQPNGTQIYVDSVTFKWLNNTTVKQYSAGWGADSLAGQDTWDFHAMEWPDYYIGIYARTATQPLGTTYVFYPASGEVDTIHVSHTAWSTVMFLDYTVGVEEKVSNPTGLSFSGAMPNPFHGATTIRYTLPVAGKADLTVYDLAGRPVRTLARGQTIAGAHSAFWDGADEAGHAMGSSIYFCRLSVAGQTLTEKLILNR